VDPDLTPEPGDFVVAQVQGAVTFRKYRARAETEFELAPMNDDWPVVKSDNDSVKVLGVMVEHRSYRNRK
jgi:SOS-response transcriptional repressor LexA